MRAFLASLSLALYTFVYVFSIFYQCPRTLFIYADRFAETSPKCCIIVCTLTVYAVVCECAHIHVSIMSLTVCVCERAGGVVSGRYEIAENWASAGSILKPRMFR